MVGRNKVDSEKHTTGRAIMSFCVMRIDTYFLREEIPAFRDKVTAENPQHRAHAGATVLMESDAFQTYVLRALTEFFRWCVSANRCEVTCERDVVVCSERCVGHPRPMTHAFGWGDAPLLYASDAFSWIPTHYDTTYANK